MKKILIGLLVFIVVALAGVKIADYVVMGGEEYYVQITTDGAKTVSKADSGQETVNYRYILPGYTKEGKEKELDFNGQLTRPLRKGAYLKITWNKKKGVTSYEEVEKKDVPKTALEKLIKG